MATYENLDYGSPDGSIWGRTSSDKVGFYGKAPVAQRAYTAAVHASSALATSASFGATQLAAVNEIQATLVALGVWATA
jgi:hypothetical protein